MRIGSWDSPERFFRIIIFRCFVRRFLWIHFGGDIDFWDGTYYDVRQRTEDTEISFLTPHYDIECNGWHVDGDFLEWDYRILNAAGQQVASISKELLHLTDTYVIDVRDPADALCALMLVLAIDAEKCSRG